MNKVIKIDLSTSGIDHALREIEKFKQDFLRKVDEYRVRIGEELRKESSLNFSSAVVNDTIQNGFRQAEVNVTVSDDGTISVVVAEGEDAVWCEFGSGVYHNGSVGSSPNPYGQELGFTIGSYGKGYGKQKAWGYYEDGQVVITRGTPATMPMYNAVMTVTQKAIAIAREVFG